VLFLGTTVPNQSNVFFWNRLSILRQQKQDTLASFDQLRVGSLFENEFNDFVLIDPFREVLDV